MATISKAQKAAMVEGREQARAIRSYLEALYQNGHSNGHDPEKLSSDLEAIQAKIEEADDPLARVQLAQDRLELMNQIAELQQAPDMDTLEAEFAKAVVPYSERKGLTYPAWRDVGVPARVLRAAGLKVQKRPVVN